MIALRLIVGGVFLYAAWTKLPFNQPWQLFAMSIDSYQVLPLTMVEMVARTLPWVELAAGLMLVAGLWLRISAPLVSAMLLVFFALMVRAYAKGMEINCGCFGPGEMISWRTLLRDGSLLAAALLLTSISFQRNSKAAE
jgi:uncharacterized membrane protein YphA (DoxX/SURF4 family)